MGVKNCSDGLTPVMMFRFLSNTSDFLPLKYPQM